VSFTRTLCSRRPVPWLIGATHYGGRIEQSFYGWLGDVRIVDRALRPDELMIAR